MKWHSVSTPKNEIKLLPTGGVSLENIEGHFSNGAFGVGMGGTLFNAKFIESKNYAGLFSHFEKYVGVVKSILSVDKM